MVWGNLIEAITEGHLNTLDSLMYWRNACILSTWPNNGRKNSKIFHSRPFLWVELKMIDSYH